MKYNGFWGKVVKTDSCWIWMGAKTSQGYGHVQVKKKRWITSRYSYHLHKGEIPKGMFVLHNCPDGDNPSCVNPEHLRLGDAKDNSDDMIAKGRAKHPPQIGRPATKGNSKLSAEQVSDIRSKRLSNKQFTDLYGIQKSQISKIQLGQSWKVRNETNESFAYSLSAWGL
jgi:hypothetical protein